MSVTLELPNWVYISSPCYDNCLTHFYKWLLLLYSESAKSNAVTCKTGLGNYRSRVTISWEKNEQINHFLFVSN